MSYPPSLSPISAPGASTRARVAEPSADRPVFPEPAAAKQEARPVVPDPSLRLEPSLGIVVLEFRNSDGEVDHSMPSERELKAYRQAAQLADARKDGAPEGRATGPETTPPPAIAEATAQGSPAAPSRPPHASTRPAGKG